MKNHGLIKDVRPGRNGEYYVRIQVGGIRKRFTLSKNKRQSEEMLRELERNILAGKLPFARQECGAPHSAVVFPPNYFVLNQW